MQRIFNLSLTFSVLFVFSFVSFADDNIVVYQAKKRVRTKVHAKIDVNKRGVAYAVISLARVKRGTSTRCLHTRRSTRYCQVTKIKKLIPGLVLVGHDLVYNGKDGDRVYCGTYDKHWWGTTVDLEERCSLGVMTKRVVRDDGAYVSKERYNFVNFIVRD